MQQSITEKVRFVLVASLILLFAMSFLAYTSYSQLVVASKRVDHARTVIIKLHRLSSNIKEAETGQRGYLLTNNPAFLESYYGKRQRTAELYAELKGMLAANESQKQRLEELNDLIAERFGRLEKIIRQYRQGEPYDLEASNQIMLALSKVIDQMQQEEERLLEVRLEKEQLYARQAPVFIVGLCFLSIVVTLVAFYRIRKDVRSRERAEHLLLQSNRDLEQKVEERTREIRRNEEHYRFMTESIPHIVWTATPSGKIDYFSQLLKSYSGISTNELLGWEWQRIIHPEDVSRTLETWNNAIASQGESRVEHRLLGKDGTYRWMLSHAVPYVQEGRVMKWFGTTTLIEEEKRATEKARKQEERLLKITDALPVLISYVDADHYYRFVNKQYESWFKKPREQIVGRSVASMLGEKGYQAALPNIEKALQGEVISTETKVLFETQGERVMKLNTIPHRDGEKIVGFYSLITDITEEKKAEEQLRQILSDTEAKNMELNRVNQILDDFVSLAAHDLKSPVSNLKLSVSLIHKLQKPEDKLRVINQFDTSVQRLDRTLSGLLEILEVQHVRNAHVGHYFFDHILEQVLENLGDRLKATGGEIQADFSDAPAVNYIKPYLLSIFHNLLSNSIKYAATERPLQIKLKTFWEGDCVVFSCTDSGIGMNLQKIGSKMFKPFKRFTAQAEGTGVGLHLVKSMLEKNGGKIELKSHPGDGTTIRCFFKNMPLNEKVV